MNVLAQHGFAPRVRLPDILWGLVSLPGWTGLDAFVGLFKNIYCLVYTQTRVGKKSAEPTVTVLKTQRKKKKKWKREKHKQHATLCHRCVVA